MKKPGHKMGWLRSTARGLRFLDFPSVAIASLFLPQDLAGEGLSEQKLREGRRFWAFQPPRQVAVPFAKNAEWARNDIDRFVLEKLEAAELMPSVRASKEELIRRAKYDLLGLPPTLEELKAFVDDESDDAYERLIDRLLEDSGYGEKWGQHWLDVIRFAESEGFEYDRHLPGAWRFRDYVIRSYNADKPFDQFIVEQIAGDEKESPTNDELIAAGFHRFGPVRRNAGNPEIALSRNEVLTERTDIIGSAFLGVTMGCARCHDHKLDPISQDDYYAMQAFLGGTQEHNKFLAPQETIDRWNADLEATQKEIEALQETLKLPDLDEEEKSRISYQIVELKKRLTVQLPTILTTKNDPENRTEVRILRRGDWDLKGERVQMHFPKILTGEKAPFLPQDHPRPRTALAEWLVGPENPLTARVLVNRVWMNHFGNGIVNTPNDFGSHGERPSHPELLDYLADYLVEQGWRLKPVHRLIMLSNTYQQSSRTPATAQITERDPMNRLLWRFNRRRLQAEEVRDSLLSVSGRLNNEMYGESVIVPVEEDMVKLLYDPKQWEVTEDAAQHDRRSVYLMAKRNLRLPFMETFDQPTLQSSCGRRESSTHAPQALELLNGKIANQLAQSFSERLVAEAGTNRQAQIERAWLLVAGRNPMPEEVQLAEAFLQSQPLREFSLAMFNLNDFLYVH